jgi:DNA-binding transcriptional MerR regulator
VVGVGDGAEHHGAEAVGADLHAGAAEVSVTHGAGRYEIGEVARRTGLSVDTVRFYEREGLFADPVERVTGRRVFTEDHVEWLSLCATLRATGMPLSALRAYADLVRAGDGTEPDRLALVREHEERLAGQMRELSRCRDLIAYKVGMYEDLSGRGEPHRTCRAPISARRSPAG